MNLLCVYKGCYPVLAGIEDAISIVAEPQALGLEPKHRAAGHQVIALVYNLGLRARVQELNGVPLIKARRLTTVALMPLRWEEWEKCLSTW